jgi:tetratricopeptide (TPR) repeat protein
VYIAMGEISKSIEITKRMEELGCADAKVYSDMGGLYLENKNYDEALKCVYESESLDSTIAKNALNFGVIIFNRDKAPDKALPYFLRAIKLDPSIPEPYYNVSICYIRMGDTVMAKKYFNWYAALSPAHP